MSEPLPPSASASSAVPEAASRPPEVFDVAAIDAYLAQQVASRGLVGLSVVVVKDGATVLSKAYGHESLDPALPATVETRFPVGSLAKQFTSASLLLLAEQHKLSLDDRVAKYYPDLTRAKDISLYDLATHTSGYADTYPLDFVDQEMRHSVTPDEILSRYAKRPLDFEPRTRWSYTGTGYVLLGRVIEKVSGVALGAFFDAHIFRPLGMTHSSYMPKEGTPGVAKGYTAFSLGPPELAVPEADGWDYGAGGIVATASDLAIWDLALMNGKVLTPASYERLVTPRTLADGQSIRYGCGIGVDSFGPETVLWHDGGESGFQSFNAIVPRTKSAVVLLSNRDDVDLDPLANDILRVLTRTERALPQVAGAKPEAAAREIFAQMQSGQVDRARLGTDFSLFLTDAKLRAAAERLRPLGPPTAVRVGHMDERGGMERSRVDFTFGAVRLEATMLRSTDGKVQQFLLQKR